MVVIHAVVSDDAGVIFDDDGAIVVTLIGTIHSASISVIIVAVTLVNQILSHYCPRKSHAGLELNYHPHTTFKLRFIDGHTVNYLVNIVFAIQLVKSS